MKLKEFLTKNTKIFLIWTIVGWLANGVGMLILQPWSEGLGVADSPTRYLWLSIFGWIGARLPMALLGFSIVAKREKWLAPRGRYQEGKEYPIFNTYTYTAIGFLTAFFTATGAIPWQAFDLAALPAAIAACYFNPIVAFFAVWLGGTLRTVFFAAGGDALSWFAALGLYDGTTWLWIGIVYWLLRDKFFKKNSWLHMVLWLLFYAVFRGTYEMDWYIWTNPMPVLAATATWVYVNFIPTSTASALIGGIVSEFMLRATGRNRKRPASE